MLFQTTFMKKLIVILAIFFIAGPNMLNAQNLIGTAWRGYFGDPINDTITFHILKDTSYVTGTKGDTLVVSHCTISHDTLTLSDIGGIYQCNQSDGVYKIKVDDNQLHFILVSDGCEGRGAITEMVWMRAAKEKKKKKK